METKTELFVAQNSDVLIWRSIIYYYSSCVLLLMISAHLWSIPDPAVIHGLLLTTSTRLVIYSCSISNTRLATHDKYTSGASIHAPSVIHVFLFMTSTNLVINSCFICDTRLVAQKYSLSQLRYYIMQTFPLQRKLLQSNANIFWFRYFIKVLCFICFNF